MTQPPIAHGGHWLVDLLYVAPLVVVLAALGYQSLRARRRGPGEQADAPPPA